MSLSIEHFANSTARIAGEGEIAAGRVAQDDDTGNRYERTTSGWNPISSGGAGRSVVGAGNAITVFDSSAGGEGAAVFIGIAYKTIQFVLTGAATTELLASNDGTNWETLITGVSSSQAFFNDEPWVYMKGNNISYTSGNVKILVGT